MSVPDKLVKAAAEAHCKRDHMVDTKGPPLRSWLTCDGKEIASRTWKTTVTLAQQMEFFATAAAAHHRETWPALALQAAFAKLPECEEAKRVVRSQLPSSSKAGDWDDYVTTNILTALAREFGGRE